MQRELFSPILPVVPFRDAEIDELMRTVAAREHPYGGEKNRYKMKLLRLFER